MRRLFVALLLAALWPLACGGGEAPPAASDGSFRVALLTPGSPADGGWNQGAWEGLQAIAAELGAEVSHQETRGPVEFEEGFRDYAARGSDLVFGHGFEYQEAAARVAADFPDTVFVTTSGSTVRPNVAPMVFELEQATYLCGQLAAGMSASGRLGLVGGQRIPSIQSTFLAFRAGAEAADPEVRVREVFTGDFSDVAAAREATMALLEEGADFLLHQANDAGRGVFRAVSDRAAAGHAVYAFGTNRDQNGMAPQVVIASAVLDIPRALLAVARAVQEGRFRPEPIRLGMRDDVVRLVLNPELEDRIPADVRARLAATERRIVAGELEVPRGDF